MVLVLDAGNRVRRVEPISSGAVDRTLVPAREILNLVLRNDGAAFAVAHNHPAGDLRPSAEDVSATARLAEAAPLVGLTMLDHLIVANDEWLSLREAGYVS
jgi:DNA repair protein RadC